MRKIPVTAIPWSILVILIAGAVTLRRCLHVTQQGGREPTSDIISDLFTVPLFNQTRPWAPTSCSIHSYSPSLSKRCLMSKAKEEKKKVHFVMFGDSHLRNIFDAFRGLTLSDKISKSSFEITYEKRLYMNGEFQQVFDDWEKNHFIPDLLVIHNVLHAIALKQDFKVILRDYRTNLTRLFPSLNKIAKSTDVFWYFQPGTREDLRAKGEDFSNAKVNKLNNIVVELLNGSNIHLWTSVRVIAGQQRKNYRDAIHVGGKAIKQFAQIILNYVCNSRVPVPKGSCGRNETVKLKNTRHPDQRKATGVGLCMAILFFLSVLERKRSHGPKGKPSVLYNGTDETKQTHLQEYKEAVFVGFRCLIYLGFIHLCDRIFPKKELGCSTALLTLLLASCIGVQNKLPEDQSPKAFLIQEARGLSLLLILIANLSSMSRIWQLNGLAYFAKSCLLTLAGLEFFEEHWQNKRANHCFYLNVLFSKSFLACLLCMVLDREFFNFYEVIPVFLVSFNISYFVFEILSFKDKEISAKGIICNFVKGLFILLPATFSTELKELLTSVVRDVFSKNLLTASTTEESLDGWSHHWEMDKFNFAFGVLVGILFQGFVLLSNQALVKRVVKSRLAVPLMVASAGVMFASLCFLFATYSSVQDMKNNYSISIILPLACYALLRASLLRCGLAYYSVVGHWIGSLWVEVVVLYHVWMSTGGIATVEMISSSTFLNACLLMSVTLLLASEFRSLTQHIVEGVSRGASVLADYVPKGSWVMSH